jgi:hypothetical protein
MCISVCTVQLYSADMHVPACRSQALQLAALQDQALQQAAFLQAQHAAGSEQQELQHIAMQQAAMRHAALQHATMLASRKTNSTAQLSESPEPGVGRPDSPTRGAVQRLQAQLRNKDEKLRQLKEAIR